ncbi:hypothetical protein LOK49_LG07G00431 [Camellia lanceoleosa]|uniref:Uncharacterized protein n=2 Tax=Camellia lanceoleosa TaxID=1840588 RepID=A0ACC0H3D0_9ERIC|nr:hypothetical protein LOK49_LG07G00431 [Camellia lanceoleosa]
MFKPGRWRSEKKIKAVFMLQFQATQVPQLKAKTLTISLVPADVGKPTVRLEKAAIVDGNCCWDNPVYETVKLIKELKTGKFNEKFYHFIVTTGSSKSGLLGEVSINFADYAEAAKPSIVSLPLKTSNYAGNGAILHVTIHNMQGSNDQRDNEEGETPTAKSHDRSLKNNLRNNDRNGNSNINFTEDDYINYLTSEECEHNVSFKNLLVENPIICEDDTTLRQHSMPKKRTVDVVQKNSHMHQRTNTDWSVGSVSDGSIVDSPNSPEENLPRDRSTEASDRSNEKLEREISMLERQVAVSELELQSLRRQVVKESKRGQDLTRQIVSLKEEKDVLQTESEQLKSLLKCRGNVEVSNQLQMEIENLNAILEEIRQELNHEKDSNTTMRMQLQKTEESNSELILAVRDLDEMLEQKNREIVDLSAIIEACKNEREASKEVSDCNNEANEIDMLKQMITDLYGEIEVYRKDREELKMHMKQLAVDYEIVKQKNHVTFQKLEQNEIEQMKMQNECSDYLATIKEFKLQIERLEKEIKKQALEISESSNTINELETQVKSLEKELEKQAQGFEDDLEGITLAKIEQEQRAIQAEEALRKTRSNNAIAAEQIQEEFRRLSVTMTSKFDENEKLTMKAVTEANDLHQQKSAVEEMLQKANEELDLMKEQYEVKLQELSDQKDLKSKQIEQMSQELKEKCMQIEKLKKQDEETHQSFSIEIQKLKSEKGRFKIKNGFSEEAEHKQKLRGEPEMQQRWSKEREELKREFDSARKEAQKLQKETNTLRSLKDEKETMVRILQSDIQKLRVQNNELKHCLSEEEQEKENLRKEVVKLEGDLQKKEEAIIVTGKKLVGEKFNLVELSEMSSTPGTFKENGVGKALVKSEVETCSGMNISISRTIDDCHPIQLLSEMELLKERNKCMEGELKEMQERYSEISLKFAEVEGERQQLVMTVRNLRNSKKTSFF